MKNPEVVAMSKVIVYQSCSELFLLVHVHLGKNRVLVLKKKYETKLFYLALFFL
jgi:hypothetical protein